MEYVIQKITKFKTPDQKEFDTKEEAQSYMRDIFVRNQLNILFNNKSPTTNSIIDIIMSNRKYLIKLFTENFDFKGNIK